MHHGGELFQEGSGGTVQDGVNRVQTKGVHVKLIQPVKGILDEEAADLIAVRTVEIEGRTPRGLITFGEVGGVIAETVSFRSQVIVDHVQDHCETLAMTGVDEPF